jgi:hypothetical protein
MAGLVFEEFEVGKTFEHGWSRTITEMDNSKRSLKDASQRCGAAEVAQGRSAA